MCTVCTVCTVRTVCIVCTIRTVCIFFHFLYRLLLTACENDFDATSESRLIFDQINVQPPVTSSVEIETIDDEFAEGTESFVCALRLTANPGDPLQTINPHTVTISITDNDGELIHKCV